MRITLGEILQICTFLIVIGIWVFGLGRMENQLLIWLEDAEEQRKEIREALE